MGIAGLTELVKFVGAGGTLITEGSTTTILPDYGIISGVTVEHPTTMYSKGAILRGVISDQKSPIVYGYEGTQLPVYFSNEPVLAAGRGAGVVGPGGGGRGGARVEGVGQDVTPNASLEKLSPFKDDDSLIDPYLETRPSLTTDSAAARAALAAGGNAAYGGGAESSPSAAPRVVMAFPTNPNDMLLSGELAGGAALSGRALAIDQKLGQGHVVMFALRPFWRWQTQGTYALGFNAIINWDHLDAGYTPGAPGGGGRGRRGGDDNNNF
jgi:hypothetical protein